MKYPEIDKYAELDSLIHRFDPRAKIITFTLLIFSFVFIEDIRIAFVSLLFSLFILLLSRIPFGFVFNRMKPGLLFVIPFLVPIMELVSVMMVFIMEALWLSGQQHRSCLH